MFSSTERSCQSSSRRRFLQRSLGTVATLGVGRPIAAGLSVGDEPTDVSWLKEVTDLPAAPADAPRLPPLLIDANGKTIGDLPTWRIRRRELARQWHRFLGDLPARPKAPPRLQVLERKTVDGIERLRVGYATLPGESTEAYLLRPAGVTGRRPAVVVFHSTVAHSIRQPAGVEGVPEKAFGLILAKLGFVALCPRNFLWPTNDAIKAGAAAAEFLRRYPRATGMARMLWESQLAVDVLAAQPQVDSARLGAIGHSLGAKEVLYLAAFDRRIRATVSSEGGIGIPFSNWEAPWYLGKAVQQPTFRLGHHQLLALVAPRPFLLIGGNSADGDRSIPYITSAQDVYRLYGSPARIGLLNHGQGHAVPPTALKYSTQWLSTYV